MDFGEHLGEVVRVAEATNRLLDCLRWRTSRELQLVLARLKMRSELSNNLLVAGSGNVQSLRNTVEKIFGHLASNPRSYAADGLSESRPFRDAIAECFPSQGR